jgi:coenzyme F420-reducing hydrogenase alpha subunit
MSTTRGVGGSQTLGPGARGAEAPGGGATRATRTIKVGALARVEGEGGLYVRVRGGKVEDVKLSIYEPPRFFEAFLRGRHFSEAPDVTARICGICPIAYQMSAVHAMEDALGVRVSEPVRRLRRLIYCGEWIESHALHIYLLHAPDFLGYESAVHLAKDHGPLVQRGLALKKAGNDIVTLFGGREIHPINVRVGGFYRLPGRAEARALGQDLERARDQALETVRWVAGFEFPDFEHDYEFVALRHESEYPFSEGRIVSSRGLDVSAREWESAFVEEHVAHSNALHAARAGGGAYFVGPQARYALNYDRLSPLAQQAAREAGLGRVVLNPFRSIVVRAVELLYACDEALRLLADYDPGAEPAVEAPVRAGWGAAATEAPRGLLWHRYELDADGRILHARIVPPTSQNQRTIEDDLRRFVPPRAQQSADVLRWACEQAVRNYDPCISCATHFLKLDLDRE